MTIEQSVLPDDLSKIYQLYDEGEQAWYDVFSAPGLEGIPVSATVPREDQQPAAVRRHLLRKGAVLPEAAEHRAIVAAVIAAEAPIAHRAARTGWRDGSSIFVSHGHVSGKQKTGTVVPPECAVNGSAGQLGRRGDLEGWQALVKVAKHSTAMTVALCAPFAAPLLRLVRRPSFALVLVGPSRCGKSTAQLVAASALGFGREEALPCLDATHAGLLAAAIGFNDHMLPINEIATARGGKNNIYEVVRDSTYALTNGQDVLRHPSWTGALAGPTTFQVLPIFSSEHSPDAWAERAGQTRDEGETARLIGVPVLAPGHGTIFDIPPKQLAREALTAWETKQFRLLRQGLPHHRGVAFPAYLDLIVRDRRRVRRRARKLIRHFEDMTAQPSMSAVARDIIAKFGVMMAGGLIAIEVGILPLHRRELARSVQRACRAALAVLPDPAAQIRADLLLLKGRLSSGAILDLDNCTKKEMRLMRNADGFRRPKGQGEEYVIRAQVFAGWFGALSRTRRTLEWLDDEGFLDHGRSRTSGRSNEWAQKQVAWPDGTRQRSISLYLPAGVADLNRDGE